MLFRSLTRRLASTRRLLLTVRRYSNILLLPHTYCELSSPALVIMVLRNVQVLEQDKDNVSVLVQRALLYESSEKYRLGADDLRLVLKIDPSNRLARSMIHRLNKMAD